MFRNKEGITFIIYFSKPCKCYDILELPIEINRLIASYNINYITITIKIILGGNYPFTKPTWVLDNVEQSMMTTINCMEYFTYMVEKHNIYNENWSPIIEIDKDILEFIQKINHFDYLIT